MSAEKAFPSRGQGRPGMPSWCYELPEVWPGDWTLPDPAQERDDDREQAVNRANREQDGAWL